MFDPHEVNRTVNEESKRFKNLLASMQEHGFIHAYPLHCVTNGTGKLKLKGGHHRLRAAQKLGIAVKYVIANDDASINELERSGPGKWSTYDFFISFCKQGIPSYLEIKEYMDRTGISLSDAASMFYGNAAGSGNFHAYSRFQEGLFKIKNREHPRIVEDIVIYLHSIGLKWANQTNMVKAISRIVQLPQFDVDRFKQKASSHKSLLEKQKNLQAYLQMIEHVYNYKSPKNQKVNLSFLAQERAQERTFGNKK